jgi:predicted nucleotidyltransferase
MTPLFISIVGSRLYGTNIASSDTDVKGFAFPTESELIGLDKRNKPYKIENSKEDADKIEGQVYTVGEYLGLCMKGNPTVIEIAFAGDEHVICSTDVGLRIACFIRETFVTKHLFKPYSAYHRAQIRKLQSQERVGKRKEIVDKYGYDVKFAMHAYRLGVQCIMAMQTGIIQPTLTGHHLQTAKEIRDGEYAKEEALKILDNIDKKMYEAYQASNLPAEPNKRLVERFLIDLHKRFLGGEFHRIKPVFKPGFEDL